MSYTTLTELPDAVLTGLRAGTLAPYLGPDMLSLCPDNTIPGNPLALAQVLTTKVSVPGKIKNKLTQAAQFIENFKHRKTLVSAMELAYATHPAPSDLHRWLAALPAPVIVDCWYDDTMRQALVKRPAGLGCWLEAQGLAQSEHFGTWYGWYDAEGKPVPDAPADTPEACATLYYKPWGGHAPAANYLVSDSDYVEVLTEIDIQTPIPALVQQRRTHLGFVFLGCRFNDQLPRSFARQIMKRSGGPHYAVMPEEPTRMEARFLEEQGITRIALTLADVAERLTADTALTA
jgi:hypothetical protein